MSNISSPSVSFGAVNTVTDFDRLIVLFVQSFTEKLAMDFPYIKAKFISNFIRLILFNYTTLIKINQEVSITPTIFL